ncbi:msrB [Lepeophtheirus salmonis]|uniref:peptide-methionine (R)-S-oxide reductase n=1 Tax=Lepeophtheirus salmonis TaxID=72036 RepID=A0A7R8CTF7_LEPSM|nr:msrB [Lepeophtheirus salmonis]CAF2925579.1 msrB [Lepeophtheirus salmonis]
MFVDYRSRLLSNLTKTELRDRLTPIEFQITQERGTERPYTNKYYKYNAKGIYRCKICSVTIFDSSSNLLRTRQDSSGIGGNLLLIGHVFKDGPKPTGLRYCVNSASLIFNATENEDGESLEEDIPMISHPATLGGCGGSTGFCTRPPKSSKSKEDTPEKKVPKSHPQELSKSPAREILARSDHVSPVRTTAKEAFLRRSTTPTKEGSPFVARVVSSSRESSPFIIQHESKTQSVR